MLTLRMGQLDRFRGHAAEGIGKVLLCLQMLEAELKDLAEALHLVVVVSLQGDRERTIITFRPVDVSAMGHMLLEGICRIKTDLLQ